MRRIQSVHISNFQIHRELSLEFSDYTGIVGATNKGKTAVMRAIEWALYNYPSGDNFITRDRDGKKVGKAVVEIVFDDGLKIIRKKGGGTNCYDIVYPDGNTMHLEGFGTGAVDEVIRAHGMHQIDLFGERQSLNVCKQLSQPFFLGETATTKAVMIGKLGKTDVVDLAIKNVSSEVRTKKQRAKEIKEELKDVKSELSELKGLGMMEKSITSAESVYEKMEYIDSKVRNIKTITSKIDDLTVKQETLKELVECEGEISLANQLVDEAIKINTKLDSIKKVMRSIDLSMDKLQSLKLEANKATVDELDNVVKMIDEIIQKSKNIDIIKQKTAKLKEMQKQEQSLQNLPTIQEIDDAIESINKGIQILEVLSKINLVNKKYKENTARMEKGIKVMENLSNQYNESVNRYKQSLLDSKKCPVCMSQMTVESIKDIEQYI